MTQTAALHSSNCKLIFLNSMNNTRDKGGDSDEDDDFDCEPGCDFPSLESFPSSLSDPPGAPVSPESSLSPRPGPGVTGSPVANSPSVTTTGSGPVSLAESMAMVDEILANGTIDRMDRIEKLESLLSAATNLASPSPQPKPLMVDSGTQVRIIIIRSILIHLLLDTLHRRYCHHQSLLS